jgi:UDP-N-acetylbacillosamine N-acetyltransferase
MPGLIFLGAGGIAIVAAEIARLQGFEIAGFLDDNPEKHGALFCGATVLGNLDMLSCLRQQGITCAVVALGSCSRRLELADTALSHGFTLPNLVHPSAIVSKDAAVAHGAIMMPGTIVNPGTRIGANIILNTGASIDHDCTIGDAVHIGPGSRLSGLVSVGPRTYIGIGSTIRESIHIGPNVLLGAGSLVLRDIPGNVVAYGSPAKVIRPNSTG